MEQTQAIATQAIEQPPTEARIPMSYAEFLAHVDESTHAEWVNGEAIIFMPPNTRHQRMVNFLHLLIGFYLQVVRAGELFIAPYAMQVNASGSVREPDLLFVAHEHAERIGEQRLNGAADLVIEVISTESAARDRADKFYEYQAAGVREYWIIDPRPGVARADFWVRDARGSYQPVPIDQHGIYHSTVLPAFKLEVAALLGETLPEPLQVAAKMLGTDALLRAIGPKM